jgi:thymidylate synthase
MSKLDEDYKGLLGSCLYNGIEKQDRTGTGTLSVFGRQIRHNMEDGFPLLTTKSMAIKTLVTELKWFLKGDTNIKYLVDNGCNIWNGDAYKAYCTFWKNNSDGNGIITQKEFIDKIKESDVYAMEWGELGPIYGKQWRNWTSNEIERKKDLLK